MKKITTEKELFDLMDKIPSIHFFMGIAPTMNSNNVKQQIKKWGLGYFKENVTSIHFNYLETKSTNISNEKIIEMFLEITPNLNKLDIDETYTKSINKNIKNMIMKYITKNNLKVKIDDIDIEKTFYEKVNYPTTLLKW